MTITPSDVGDVAVAVGAIEAVAFCALYARTVDWRDPMGRHVMAFVGVLGLVLTLSVVRWATGSATDSGWFAWLRGAVFCLVPGVLGWRIVIYWQLQHRSRE